MFELPRLPYSTDAPEPHIDAKTPTVAQRYLAATA